MKPQALQTCRQQWSPVGTAHSMRPPHWLQKWERFLAGGGPCVVFATVIHAALWHDMMGHEGNMCRPRADQVQPGAACRVSGRISLSTQRHFMCVLRTADARK